MRILNGSSYLREDVATLMSDDECGFVAEGEDHFTFNLPLGYSVQVEQETNNSTSISLYNDSGEQVMFWNSGTFIACSLLGAGAGLMIGTYARNARVGALAQKLVSYGCSKAVNSTMEDGDEYVPPC